MFVLLLLFLIVFIFDCGNYFPFIDMQMYMLFLKLQRKIKKKLSKTNNFFLFMG